MTGQPNGGQDRSWSRLPTPERRAGALDDLKRLISVLGGLALTNLLAQVMAMTRSSAGVIGSRRPPWEVIGVAVSLVLLVFRFFYGNLRHLDDLVRFRTTGKRHDGIDAETIVDRQPSSRRMAIDFSVALVEALGLGIATFLIASPDALLVCLGVVFVVDVCWLFLFVGPARDRLDTPKLWARTKWWGFINTLGAVGLVVALLVDASEVSRLWTAAAIGAATSVVDFGIWFRDFYFPEGTPEV
jgi:hypothetical protein